MSTRPFWMKRFPPARPESGGPSVEVIYQDHDVNPYRGWKHYFPDEKYKAGSEAVKKIEAGEEFFRSVVTEAVREEVEERRFLQVAAGALEGDAVFSARWPAFRADLKDDPEATLASLGLALHQVVSGGSSEELPAVFARVVEAEAATGLRRLKAGLLGKLVAVRGAVARVGAGKLRAAALGFRCAACGAAAAAAQPAGRYRPPTHCPRPACRSRTFSPLLSSPLTTTRAAQTIKIQENIADDQDQREGGRVPRTLEVELSDDLVDTCAPGDNVVVTGVVKVRSGEESSGKRKHGGNLYSTYLEATALVNGKGASARSQGNVGVEFSLKDYYAIQEIHEEARLFRLLVNSVCPGVYGHEMVKAGLLLGLVGGAGEGRARGSSHVLVVGDPGLGKTHLLHAAAALAPRGVYVSGNTASSSGLTVTLVKEAGGDYALEAGALVLADNGVCCIDEFDKMTSQHSALLEAMEQQSVSVAKGGVVCTLPARAAVVAAANPAAGHYDASRSLSDNLRMGRPLLSRFDLVFVLLDRPDEKSDVLLSEHVMALHAGKRRRTEGRAAVDAEGAAGAEEEEDSPLAERLKVAAGERVDYVPQALLRKYIAYVKRWVAAPRLEAGAAAVLEEYYLGLRGGGDDGEVATARRLEAALRLTRARARVELREAATEADALDVVQLMSWSTDLLSSSASAARPAHHSASRNRSGVGSKAKKLMAALEMRSQLEGRDTFHVSEMKEISTALALHVPDFHGFVSTLNTQGFLLKKGPNLYKLLSA